jgi:DNA primase
MMEELTKGEVVGPEYFIRGEEEDLKKEAIDLMTSKYELSENWENMHKVEVTKSEHVLDVLVTTTILRLKWRNIQLMISENRKQLQDAEKSNNVDELESCLKIGMKLKEAEKEIAKLLGNVISK